MRFNRSLLIAFILLTTAVWAEEDENEVADEENSDVSHGLGTDIDWVQWPNALEASQEQKKPVFLLILKSWCGACNRLKESFKTSPKRKEFVELSKQFVMVHTVDEDEPEDDKYAPDGRYIPRLYFIDLDGELFPIDNKKNYPKNRYYFPMVPDVLKAMKQVLKLHKKSSEEKTESEAEPESKKFEAKKSETEKPIKEEKKTKDAEKEDKKEKTEKVTKEKSTDKKEKSKETKSKDEKKEKKSADQKTEKTKKESTKTDAKKDEKSKKDEKPKKSGKDKKTEL
ncbi:Folliculin [Aphelenchoides besseyi]|nr:Folliculin [Aphelenchoides besseyi]